MDERDKLAETDKAMDALLEAWARAQELDRIRDAAPALLEALEQSQALLDDAMAVIPEPMYSETCQRIQAQFDRNRAAIASARGVKK